MTDKNKSQDANDSPKSANSTDEKLANNQSENATETKSVSEAQAITAPVDSEISTTQTSDNANPEEPTSPSQDQEMGKAPTAGKEPSADQKPSSGNEPSAGEPSAGKEPSADNESSANQQPSTDDTQASLDDEALASDETSEKPKPEKSSRGMGWLGMIIVGFIFILLCAAIAGGAYVVRDGKILIEEQRSQITELQQRLTQTQSGLDQQLAAAKSEANQAQAGMRQKQQELLTAMGELDKRVIAQNKRLRSMSTTSREDWLLAEAEYLLKLANQRVLIEKNAEGAAALLAEADAILRDLSDPDLFSIRREVKKDLAALRLTDQVDVEGIYLSLHAMAQQVDSIPLYPSMQQMLDTQALTNEDRVRELTNLDDKTWYQRVGGWFGQTFKKSTAYFRIYTLDEKPKPLMPPEQAGYLQQNLHMMIERAQLALMREQQDVYQQSLAQIKTWIAQYYPRTKKSEAFVAEINKIEQQNIVREMPDISASLELLQVYIIDLHRVGDAKANNNSQ